MADLGCGQGDLVHCLVQAGYTNVIGIDHSAEQVAEAHALNRTQVKLGKFSQFAAEHSGVFDIVFLMDVLEHLTLEEFTILLDNVYNALAVGGSVIIHVPNAEGVLGMRIRYGDLTHTTAFTRQSITQGLRLCGFVAIEAFEERPIVHGAMSLVRYSLWMALTLRERLLVLAETGMRRAILSQNMLVVARRP